MMTKSVPARVLSFVDRGPDPGLEWIVTNGLGGYASGLVAGAIGRRFHGLLIASLPSPAGRMMMLPGVAISVMQGDEAIELESGVGRPVETESPTHLREFRLDAGLPTWTFEIDGIQLIKRIVMPYGRNTTHILLRLAPGSAPLRLRLRPFIDVRPHEGRVSLEAVAPARVTPRADGAEIEASSSSPLLRWKLRGADVAAQLTDTAVADVTYPTEEARGYDHQGRLWSPGLYDVQVSADADTTFTVSTEPWDEIDADDPADALSREQTRRAGLLAAAGDPDDDFVAELVLAADQFVTLPAGRPAEIENTRALGDEPRTVIAGYHWFTDWGRDTMISLEGLTLATGRAPEAGCILRTFGRYIRDGLIPNLFPEGERLGLYHTVDATLWYFQAVHRYVEASGDRATLTLLLPALVDIVERHIAGTRFGIHVDSADALLTQGCDDHPLTWMDAKMGPWIVTPRRGKPVEVNALWYNAVRLLGQWLSEASHPEAPRYTELAAAVERSFNARFWNPSTGHLFDVVDGPDGDDAACRPNQVLAIALAYPTLDSARWPAVLDVVEAQLLTPYGLRTLAPDHKDFQRSYNGDLRARDGAYHQGTVWPWLIGPFIDAWLRARPDDRQRARQWLAAFPAALSAQGMGSLSEIFDAEPPFRPRGCIAQAWSVAEVLRAWKAVHAPRA